MNYSETQIEELRQMILDNSVDPSILTVDDCAEVLYFEVDNDSPNKYIIDYCVNFINNSTEAQNITTKRNIISQKHVMQSTLWFRTKAIKFIVTIAALFIIIPSIAVLGVYAVKYIQYLIFNNNNDNIQLYSNNSSDGNINTETTKKKYESISDLPTEIKNLITDYLYSNYIFESCKSDIKPEIKKYKFRFKNTMIISFYQLLEQDYFYALELPKEEESLLKYESVKAISYYICENEGVITAVSMNQNTTVTVSGALELEEMKLILDNIEVPENLP